ncbi:MAG: molecular chaperone DnaJ [Acidimicrobiales bacterium]
MAPQREWFEKDYYKVLSVPQSATGKEISRAYRKLAKQFHPDANKGNPGAEERFKDVSAAYDVLGDAAKRKEYDEVRRLGALHGAGPGPFAGGGGNGGFGERFRIDDISDISDLFGGIFNRGARTSRGTGPQRGADLEADLHLSFVEAVEGLTTAVNLTSEAMCSTCTGTGAAPGSSPRVCPECKGQGVRADNQGLFSLSQPCPNCAGRGTIVDKPCPSCRGTGTERRGRQVRVRIPAGVEDGQRIRVKGRGGTGRNGGPSGDLYVKVHVEPHKIFGRAGENLTVSVPVTFAEAALGATVQVPTLGRPVTVKVPAGTSAGQVLRVRGHGVKKAAGGHGDLLVRIEVVVPKHLSDAERSAIEALAAVPATSPRANLEDAMQRSST